MFGFIIFLVVVACIIFGPVFFFLEIFSTFINIYFNKKNNYSFKIY